MSTVVGCSNSPLPADFYDDCSEAARAEALPSGTHSFTPMASSNALNPGSEGCTESDLPGPDTLVPVVLDPNGTVVLTLDMPGGNPAVYLLRDCTRELSCTVGFQAPDESLTLSTSNQQTEPERLYVVVDTSDELLPFVMGLSLF